MNVVFITEVPRAREAKMAAAARMAGYTVSLVYQRDANYDLGAVFTNVHKVNDAAEAIEVAARYKPRVYHCFSPTAHYTCALLMYQHPGKVIFEFTDLLEGMVTHNNPTYEVNQRYCIEKADGLIVRDRQWEFARDTLSYRVPAKVLQIPDMCWDNVVPEPRQDRQLHVVVAGNFGMEKRGEGDWGYLKLAETFARNGIHFHIYPFFFWHNATEERYRMVFADYFALGEQTGLVHVHKSVGSDVLSRELSKYDYGLNVIWGTISGEGLNSRTTDHLRLCGSSRNTEYLDAGLAVLLSPELEFQKQILNGASVEATKALLEDPRSVLVRANAREQVAAARERLAVRNYSSQLAEFYESI